MKKYFIAIPVEGPVKEFHSSLAHQLANLVARPPITDTVPAHITLVPEFETDDISTIEYAIMKFCTGHIAAPVWIEHSGFFKSRVAYMKCTTAGDRAELPLASELDGYLSKRFPLIKAIPHTHRYVPHITLAHAQSGAEFARFRALLKKNPYPGYLYVARMIAVYALEDGKWKIHSQYELPTLHMGGAYQHFKNRKKYRVVGLRLLCDTDEWLVEYVPLYKCEFDSYLRSIPNFTELVEHEGQQVPRFTLLKDR